MCGSVRWRAGRWLVAEDPASRRRAERRAGVCIDTRSMGVVLIACVQRCPPWARRFVRWGDPRAATESTATPLPKPMPSSCHSSWRSSGRVGRRRQRFGSPRRHDDGRILSAAYSRTSSLAALPISTRTRLPPARPSRVTPATTHAPVFTLRKSKAPLQTPPPRHTRYEEERAATTRSCASPGVPPFHACRTVAGLRIVAHRRCVDASIRRCVEPACHEHRAPSVPLSPTPPHCKQKNLRGRRRPRPWSLRSPSRRGWRRRRSGPCWPRAPSAWWQAPRRRSCRPQRARRKGWMGGWDTNRTRGDGGDDGQRTEWRGGVWGGRRGGGRGSRLARGESRPAGRRR